MLTVNFNTKNAINKLERMPDYVKKAVSSTSDKVKYDVYKKTLPIAPRMKEVLRHSILSESYDFVETKNGVSQKLVYDAWNPLTGFHYAKLRYYETTTGKKEWAKYGGEYAMPLIEKEIVNAVKKGLGGK